MPDVLASSSWSGVEGSKMLVVRVAFLLALLTQAARGLQCRCNQPLEEKPCDETTQTCSVDPASNGTCRAFAFSGKVLYWCETNLASCPFGRCCRDTDLCNERVDGSSEGSENAPSIEPNPPVIETVPSAIDPDPVTGVYEPPPPRSERKLKCECTNGSGSACVRKKRRAGDYCVIKNGWCAARATRLQPNGPVRYSYFCTASSEVCTADESELSDYGVGSVTNCCSTRKCNENLKPIIPNRSQSHNSNDQTQQPPKEASSTTSYSNRMIWCHCSMSNDCPGQHQSRCRTYGACFSRNEISQTVANPLAEILFRNRIVIRGCVHNVSVNPGICEGGSCCTTDCCNGNGGSGCRPAEERPTAVRTDTVHTVPRTTGMPSKPTFRCRCTANVAGCRTGGLNSCEADGACVADVKMKTQKVEYYCLSQSKVKIMCSLFSSSVTIRKFYTARDEYGHEIQRYCCRPGGNCNKKHPRYPDAEEEEYIDENPVHSTTQTRGHLPDVTSSTAAQSGSEPSAAGSRSSDVRKTIIIAAVCACAVITISIAIACWVVHREYSHHPKTPGLASVKAVTSPLSHPLEQGKLWIANGCTQNRASTRNGSAQNGSVSNGSHLGPAPRSGLCVTVGNGHVPCHKNPLQNASDGPEKVSLDSSKRKSVIIRVSNL